MSGKLAFIGLGAMGCPMAAQLAKAGLLQAAVDARLATTIDFCSGYPGVQATNSPAQACDAADAVITMLPTSKIVEQVVFGPEGIAHAVRRPRLLVDMSSGEPTITRDIGARLAPLGVAMIDAPVSGGVARARQATLAIMAGGDAVLLDTVRPALERLGRLTHVGALGAGQALKALNNMASAAGLAIASEVLWLGQRFGLQPETVVDVLNASSGMNNATQSKLKQFVLSGTYASGFGLDLMVKDLGIAVGIAEALEAQAPFSRACLRLWREAAEHLGPGRDHTEIARVSAQHTGVRLPP